MAICRVFLKKVSSVCPVGRINLGVETVAELGKGLVSKFFCSERGDLGMFSIYTSLSY
jgi:hypothetical protein